MKKYKGYDNQRFTDILRILKDAKKIKTLKDLAAITGYNYTYLSQINTGDKEFNAEIEKNIRKHFSLEDYTDNTDNNNTDNSTEQPTKSDDLLREELRIIRHHLSVVEKLLNDREV